MSVQIQSVFSSVQVADIQTYINNYRELNQAPPMLWDESIYLFSQNWSNYMMSSKLFKHSGIASYGENIAYFQGYGTDIIALIKKSIDLWYNEIVNYDFTNPEYSNKTGHFTCLVWKSSTKFAMGIAIDSSSNEAYITMNTNPPGNVIGNFETNVLPTIPSNAPILPPVTPVPVTPVPVTPVPVTPVPVTPVPVTPVPVMPVPVIPVPVMPVPVMPVPIPQPIVPISTQPSSQIISSTLKHIIYKLLSNMIYAVNTNQPRQVLISIIHQLVELLKNT
jgi:hypothetical protein